SLLDPLGIERNRARRQRLALPLEIVGLFVGVRDPQRCRAWLLVAFQVRRLGAQRSILILGERLCNQPLPPPPHCRVPRVGGLRAAPPRPSRRPAPPAARPDPRRRRRRWSKGGRRRRRKMPAPRQRSSPARAQPRPRA